MFANARRIWRLCLLAAGCLLAAALLAGPTALASPLFDGDFETGNLGQWENVQAIPGRITVVRSPVAQGSFSGRFEVRRGDNEPETGDARAEVISGPEYGRGQTRCFHLRTRIASWDYRHWGFIWQLHDQSGGSPPIALEPKPGAHLWLGDGSGGSGYWSGRLPRSAKWFDLTVAVRFGSRGSLRVWLNGNAQHMANGRFVYKKIDTLGQGPDYDKLGIYRSSAATTKAVVYHDDYRVASGSPRRHSPCREMNR
ncbi:MAG TPA: heparin lyase I family protein [Solirubrobacterales bacterium]|nr:heparin lyase I family protein [Solirubrobacterales bacterium]